MKFYANTFCLAPEDLVPFAQAAEEAGFDGLTIPDHLVYPKDFGASYPYDYELFPAETPFLDPWVMMGHLAAATTTLRFLNAAFVAPLRDPLTVAKSIATAAILSGYRVDVGFANGWLQGEFEAAGKPFRARAERLDEMIEIMRLLWRRGWGEYDGEHYRFPAIQMNPVPAQPPRILGGGEGPRALGRAARLDGWIGPPMRLADAERWASDVGAARRLAGTADREDFEMVCGFIGESSGIPALDDCKRLQEMGYTTLFVVPWETSLPWTPRNPGREAALDSVARFAAEVIERFRRASPGSPALSQADTAS